ncbi:MAG: tRNA glutamyl-Q(34) synthetase GluQRS [Gammaproteobacteria bacterium]|nr:tRNA glutamyl-Q(34) synthetase GluQRS [Gammaproteobacteria bacterium]
MDKQTSLPYRSRFAPTPSGPLHFGSLTTAVGSFLQAKSQNGEWLVRIDDIDPPRITEGATDSILRCLEKYGLFWDEPVFYQSTRDAAYQAALNSLNELNLLYPCACSRKDIAETNARNYMGINAGTENPSRYPGTCRNGIPQGKQATALRIKTHNSVIEFDDLFFGKSIQNVETEVGDFLVKRVGGYFAYHLAVAVDDAYQGITEIIRGCDLLDSTHRQIYLQKLLKLNTPVYGHLPLVFDEKGYKMSKQNYNEIDVLNCEVVPTLYKALQFLGQQPPKEILDADQTSVWDWAIEHWQLQNVPKADNVPYGADC